jgi:DNA-binding transcriptional LysR family regulator
MDLRQLKHILVLSELGSYAKAAEALHLSQSALSRSIQCAEECYGIKLFERGRFGAVLTPSGHEVIKCIRSILDAEQSLNETVSLLKGLKVGELKIGAGPYPSVILLNKVSGEFLNTYPQVRLFIKVDNWLNLRKQLLDNDIDLFIADARELLNDPQLSVVPLPALQGVAFCAAKHPLLTKLALEWNDLLQYPLAMPKLPLGFELLLESQSDAIGGLARRLECDNISMLLEIVMQSSAFSIAPYPVITEYVKAGKLRPLKIAELPTLFTAFGVVTRQQKQLSPAATAFTQLLLEYVARD